MKQGYSYTWLRYWRERAGIPQGEIAKCARVSKATVNALERGSQYPSPGVAQLIVSQLRKRLDVDLRIQDVFPADPAVKSPGELAYAYWCDLQKVHPQGEDRETSDAIRESEEEREIRQQEEVGEINYRRELEQMSDDELRAWEPTAVVFDDGTRITEQPPAWFIRRVHAARQRAPVKVLEAKPRARTDKPRSRRRSSRKHKITKASSSDDPGESEPALGGRRENQLHLGYVSITGGGS